jgi:hypothetical protein
VAADFTRVLPAVVAPPAAWTAGWGSACFGAAHEDAGDRTASRAASLAGAAVVVGAGVEGALGGGDVAALGGGDVGALGAGDVPCVGGVEAVGGGDVPCVGGVNAGRDALASAPW